LHIKDSTFRSVGTLTQPSSRLIFGAFVAPPPCSTASDSCSNAFPRTESTLDAPNWLNRAVSLHLKDMWPCEIRYIGVACFILRASFIAVNWGDRLADYPSNIKLPRMNLDYRHSSLSIAGHDGSCNRSCSSILQQECNLWLRQTTTLLIHTNLWQQAWVHIYCTLM
jgi:hypothetical protein